MPNSEYRTWVEEREACWRVVRGIFHITHDDLPLAFTQAHERALLAVRADERAAVEAEIGQRPFGGESGIVHRRVVGALRSAIEAHGPINLHWIGAATKRVVGALLAGGGATGSAPALGAGPSGFESQPSDQDNETEVDPNAPLCAECGEQFRRDEQYGGWDDSPGVTIWLHFECAGNYYRDKWQAAHAVGVREGLETGAAIVRAETRHDYPREEGASYRDLAEELERLAQEKG